MARLRVSRDAKESVWRPFNGRHLMISQKISRGNSGERFEGAIVVGRSQWSLVWGSVISAPDVKRVPAEYEIGVKKPEQINFRITSP